MGIEEIERFALKAQIAAGIVVTICVAIGAWIVWEIIVWVRRKKEVEKEEPKLRRFIFLAEDNSVKEVQELFPDEDVDKAMEECRNKYGDELYYIEGIDRTEAAYKLLDRLKRKTLV